MTIDTRLIAGRWTDEQAAAALQAATTTADARAILAAIERHRISSDWLAWLALLFPQHATSPPGDHHAALWRWIWALEVGEPADPFIAIWPRGGAKSTTAELGVAAVAARRTRRYALYVSGTQDRADDHVGNIAAMLESAAFSRVYPAAGSRKVGAFGSSKGWRRNRIRTASGFTVDALGLDTAARGVKVEEDRPDLIVLDDLDDANDSSRVTERKIRAITRGILPAGAQHVAVLGVQNLVHVDSIFSRLVDGRADFLSLRTVSGPVPAVRGLVTEPGPDGRVLITGGEATWAGMPLEACQHLIDSEGLSAFLTEAQHEVEVRSGGLFSHLDFARCPPDEVPDLVEIVVACDPAVTDTDQSDSMGIQADGLASDGRIYRLRSWEQRATPLLALRQALVWAYELGAGAVIVETDQGGDTWESVYREARAALLEEREDWRAKPPVRFVAEKAGAGLGPKAHRAAQMVPDYERRRIVHVVGDHEVLERALHRFPLTKPLDLVDASFWSWRHLRRHRKARTSTLAGRGTIGR